MRRITLIALFGTVLLALGASATVAAGRVTVFAAASLKDALDEVAQTYEADTGDRVVPVLAGSSLLARQIETGAPADIFISANERWMDRLDGAGRIVPGSRVDLLGNALVLVRHGPADPAAPEDLAEALGGKRLAMALVDAVPAGIYGKAALQSLGLWSDVAPDVVEADNARAALALVALGAAPLGVVYATDAAAEPRVSVVATFPEDSHPPIVYPAAIVAGHDSAPARRFWAFLRGAVAAGIFRRHGFTAAGR